MTDDNDSDLKKCEEVFFAATEGVPAILAYLDERGGCATCFSHSPTAQGYAELATVATMICNTLRKTFEEIGAKEPAARMAAAIVAMVGQEKAKLIFAKTEIGPLEPRGASAEALKKKAH
jgi:hypothetical protein